MNITQPTQNLGQQAQITLSLQLMIVLLALCFVLVMSIVLYWTLAHVVAVLYLKILCKQVKAAEVFDNLHICFHEPVLSGVFRRMIHKFASNDKTDTIFDYHKTLVSISHVYHKKYSILIYYRNLTRLFMQMLLEHKQ